MKSAFIPRLIAAFAAIATLFCCQPEEKEIPVSSITLSPSSLTLTVGESATVSASVSPSDATDKTVVWMSEGIGVAAVQEGTVIAVAPGSTRIVASCKDGSVKAYCPVTVKEKESPVDPTVDPPVDPPVDPTDVAVTGVTLSESEVGLIVGDTYLLVATVEPEDATNKKVGWSSSDPEVAAVDGAGTVTAVKEGVAVVTAETADGGFKASCKVSVTRDFVAVTGITLSESKLDIHINESVKLVATVEPENATNRKVKWESSSPAKASVDENGTVTGLDKGAATITATTEDGGFAAECKVVVNHVYPTKLIIVAPEGLDPDTGIVAGDSFRLKVAFEPENATYRQVEWECMPKAYADLTVVADDEIEVLPLKPGKAKIKVSNNPGLTSDWPGEGSYFTINYAPAQAVSFEQSEITVGYYSSKADAEKNYGKLYAKVLPEEFAKQDLEWWSDDPGICAVIYGGKDYCDYQTTGVGTTVIHARSASYPDVQGECVVHVTDERVYIQSIELSSSYMQRAPGNQFYLTATVYPDNASVYDFDWEFEEGALMVVSSNRFNPPSLTAAPLHVGKITIKLVDRKSGVSAECELDAVYKNPTGYYKWVDLGLSVYWAKYNYFSGFYPGNSTRYQPADFRWSYLAFGELTEKSNYSDATYLYKSEARLWDLMDNDGCLKPKYDVMTQDSGDSQWRLPSSEEWQELYDGCTWEAETLDDGTTGMLGTSKINGETIFLPFSGRMEGNKVQYESFDGFYWSRTMCQDASPESVTIYGKNTGGNYETVMDIHKYVTFQGLTVRGVLPKEYNP